MVVIFNDIMVEYCFYPATALAGIIFLIIRSFIKTKLIPENWVSKDLLDPEEETLEANIILLAIW